jgi:6-pyruvoyl-tetrahydropterin synthase
MVIDFDEAQSALASVTREFHDADLKTHKGLAGRNPTAEALARYIFERLDNRGYATVCGVEVREAPGCAAAYQRFPFTVDAE